MKFILLLLFSLLITFAARSQYSSDVIVETILKTDTTTLGQKIIYPQCSENEVTILKVTIKPGGSTGWHKHDIPVFAYIMEGNLTVQLENNRTMSFPKNTSFSEVFNTFHNGVNYGKENVVLIAFYLGEKGKALSERKSQNE